MRIFAISDLHLSHAENRRALRALPTHPKDALILAGDVGESLVDIETALQVFTERFARVLWVPGNHELYSFTEADKHLRGVAKYEACVTLCRRYGVLTPEDDFEVWHTAQGPFMMAPLFLLYDYTYCPPEVRAADVVAWAAEDGVHCNDEVYLHPDPYPSRQQWCAARCAFSAQRLEQAMQKPHPLILVNHYPLRHDLVRIPRVPRLAPWCGTAMTHDWHRRFRAAVVVSGHLHVRATDWRDGVRFEEVSLGYPGDWRGTRGMEAYLRPIVPAPPDLETGSTATVWRYAN